MSSSTDMTNIDKHLLSSPSTYNNHSQSRRQPAAMQKWLNETPHEEPWTTFSRIAKRHSTSEGGKVRKELDQGFAQGFPQGIDGYTTRSADIADTANPLSSAHHTSHGQPQPRQLQPAAMQQWLRENPGEEPWCASSRTAKQCSASEAQGLLKELEKDMAQDMNR